MSDAKIEPWMTAAAEHIHKLRMGSLEVQFKMGLGATHPNLSNTEQNQLAQQLTIDAIARVLATHAPAQDQAIGPGDVVQFNNCHSVMGCCTYIVTGVTPVGRFELNYVGSYPGDLLVRIGRAQYWPDGSPVEGGGPNDSPTTKTDPAGREASGQSVV
jgi:hypothetical protein